MDDIQLFALDLAGTTVRDEGVVLYSFSRVARAQALPVDPGWVAERLGRDKIEVFRELLTREGEDAERAADLADEFQRHVATAYARRPPMPTAHAVEVVEGLRAQGVQVAFTTNFTRATATLILKELGWSRYLLVAADEVPRGRPAPDLIREAMRRAGVDDPRRVGAAGDTPADLVAATQAGCALVVGVGCGTHSLAELAGSPHTHLLPDLGPLPELVASRGLSSV